MASKGLAGSVLPWPKPRQCLIMSTRVLPLSKPGGKTCQIMQHTVQWHGFLHKVLKPYTKLIKSSFIRGFQGLPATAEWSLDKLLSSFDTGTCTTVAETQMTSHIATDWCKAPIPHAGNQTLSEKLCHMSRKDRKPDSSGTDWLHSTWPVLQLFTGLTLSRQKKILDFSRQNCRQNVEQMHIY